MKEIPDIAKEGILIDPTDPQPEIRKNAETARDWEYSEEAAFLYGMAVVFKDRFLDPILLTDRGRLPDPVISFANLRNKNTLAAYTLVRNPQGLLFEITMNTEHYVNEEQQDGEKKKVWSFGRWAHLETLLHEQVHLWQQNFGDDPVKPGRPYHNREFVSKCESLGLHPMPGAGCHTHLADEPFSLLMKELGIPPPDLTKKPRDLELDWFKWLLDHAGKARKGTSTLHKWTCPECGLNARFGIKGNPEIVHEPCSQKKGEKVFFVQADGLTHTIFEAESDLPDKPDTGELQ